MQKLFHFRALKYNFCASTSSSSYMYITILYFNEYYINHLFWTTLLTLHSLVGQAYTAVISIKQRSIVRSEDMFSNKRRRKLTGNYMEFSHFGMEVKRSAFTCNYGINLKDIWSDEMIDSSIVGLSAASQSMIFIHIFFRPFNNNNSRLIKAS